MIVYCSQIFRRGTRWNSFEPIILLYIPHQHDGAAGRATLLWRDHVTLQPGCTPESIRYNYWAHVSELPDM